MCRGRCNEQIAAPVPVPAAADSAFAAGHGRYWSRDAGLSGDVFEERVMGSANKLMEKPFGLMLEALDEADRTRGRVPRQGMGNGPIWREQR